MSLGSNVGVEEESRLDSFSSLLPELASVKGCSASIAIPLELSESEVARLV